MKFYIDTQGKYYQGDKVIYSDIEVIERPSGIHIWNGTEWVIDEDKVKESESIKAKTELVTIDIKSIRAIRECLSLQKDCPEILKQYEENAVELRKKV